MKEITRIHIAKVPYDIETIAKKEMTKYIESLESYANDKEIFQDIEIRITELLAERGIGANGVITIDDVRSIRQQLGEPKDFAFDGEAKVEDANVNREPAFDRKLYRNVDNAILGGVMSGLASYLRVDVVIVRLIFVVLFFVTSGTATLVYIILWIVVPPAKTSAEKLQMSGRPVTIDSIRELNENEPSQVAKNERAHYARLAIKYSIGTVLLVASVCTIIFTIFAGLGLSHFSSSYVATFGNEWMNISALILAVISGFLLSILFALGTCAFFCKSPSKNLFISMIIVIIAGLATFSTSVGLAACQSWQSNEQIHNKTVTLPVGVSNAIKAENN